MTDSERALLIMLGRGMLRRSEDELMAVAPVSERHWVPWAIATDQIPGSEDWCARLRALVKELELGVMTGGPSRTEG